MSSKQVTEDGTLTKNDSNSEDISKLKAENRKRILREISIKLL